MIDWISSDFHYNHVNIVEWRGLESLEVMNEMIRTDWLKKVGENDSILILGDAVMGPRIDGLAFFADLPGQKFLMPGNHDYPWSGMSQKHRDKWTSRYTEVFDLVPEIIENLLGTGVDACHFPYNGDHTDEERFLALRPTDNGRVLLHGHIHDLWKTKGRQINVGWDVRDGIWSWEDCLQEIAEVKVKENVADVLSVSEEAYDELVEMLNRPDRRMPRLMELMKRKTPWDEGE